MKKISLPALALSGAAIVGLGIWASTRSQAQPSAPVDSAAPIVAVADEVADEEGFRPSQFEGVSVRERPQAAKGSTKASASTSSTSRTIAGKRGWIKVLPGEPNPRAASVAAPQRAVTWSKVASGAGGGETIIIAGPMHASLARRDKNGRVVIGCVPGESAARHRSHTVKSVRKIGQKNAVSR